MMGRKKQKNLMANKNIQRDGVCKKGMDRRSFLKKAAVVSAVFAGELTVGSRKGWTKKPKELIIGVVDTPGGFDMDVQASAREAVVYTNMNDGIIKHKSISYPYGGELAKGVLWPDLLSMESNLIESWSVAPDRKKVTCKLRKGAKSHHGNELTSADMKYTVERSFGLKSIWLICLTSMNVTSPEQFRIIDKYTFEFNTPDPTPLTVNTLANKWLGVIDHLVAKKYMTTDDPWSMKYLSRNPHSWGAYTCREFQSGSHCTFEAVKNYWREPKIEKVILKAIPESGNRMALLERGKIDIADHLLAKEIEYLIGKKGIKVISTESCLEYFLAMNCKKKPFDDVRVRQAMNYACPQEEIVKSVFRNFAQPARSNIARVCPEYTSEFWKYNYNPDRAAKLLADAGYPQGFEIELDFSDQEPFSEETCVIMRGALNKIKVECKLRKIPGAAFMERLFKRDFVFAANTQAPLVPDAAYWASLFYKSGVFLNFLELNDPELDKMIDTVRLIYELKKRQEMAKKIQERILDLAPRVFICSVNTNVAMRDDVGGTFHASWVPTTYYWDKLDKA